MTQQRDRHQRGQQRHQHVRGVVIGTSCAPGFGSSGHAPIISRTAARGKSPMGEAATREPHPG
ncbi:hypothetical protein CFK39_04660 [Brachybacterium avium]|uniref:Uncharacterized protein n=1 Tax=Brachybacterium avium TaxID=2017485 RepID=A0A220UAV8_9MICO|nr:hypothetical protein CFK39_04660 [Brachybacterium avium]